MRKWVWWVGSVVVAACNQTTGGEGTDSSTHWLDACRKDSDCGSEWECICGVCATECATQSPCEDTVGNRAGVCAELSCDDRSEVALCTAACSDSKPCPKGLSCSEGVCTPDGAVLSGGSHNEGDAGSDMEASTSGRDASADLSSVESTDSASSGATSTEADAPIPLEEFAPAFLRATCELLWNCLSNDYDRAKLVLGSIESCMQNMTWMPIHRDVEARVEAARSERFRYDPELGRLAVTRMQQGCSIVDDPFDSDSSLDEVGPEVFDGSVELGGSCNEDTECRGDAYCAEPRGHCMGSCQPKLQLGEPCAEDAPCGHTNEAWPLACDSSSEPRVCEPTVVVADLGVDQPCNRLSSSLGNAREFRTCATNLWCTGERSNATTCAPLVQTGEACSGSRCEEGALCTERDDQTLVCMEPRILQMEGADCSDFSNICDPLSGLSCDEETRVCIYEGDGTLGSGCGDTLCSPELYCDLSRETPVCSPRIITGSACPSEFACESDHCFSDGDVATCIPRFCSVP